MNTRHKWQQLTYLCDPNKTSSLWPAFITSVSSLNSLYFNQSPGPRPAFFQVVVQSTSIYFFSWVDRRLAPRIQDPGQNSNWNPSITFLTRKPPRLALWAQVSFFNFLSLSYLFWQAPCSLLVSWLVTVRFTKQHHSRSERAWLLKLALLKLYGTFWEAEQPGEITLR